MKKIKSQSFKVFLLSFILLALYCCSSSDGANDPIPKPKPPPEPKPKPLPVWNKGKTADIYFFSTFNQKGISSGEATNAKIISFLKGKKHQLVLLDKSEVNPKSGLNASVTIASAIKGYHFFGVNKVTDDMIEGTAIITERRRGAFLEKSGRSLATVDVTTISKDKQFSYHISGDCFISGTKTFVKDKIAFPFATTRFERSKQVNDSESSVIELMKSDYILMGSIPKTLKEELKKMVSSQNGMNYKIDFLEGESTHERVTFIMHPHFWVVREKELKRIETELAVAVIKIEANVF